ncbi:MAG: hypothetical protein QTN59_09650 [Candidatus Electrothrix communis]|nr:MAG: hypothetical protein QTN59_09650 [Candidatus Electrothrix communis]
MSIRIKGDYYRLLPGVLEEGSKTLFQAIHSKSSQDGENKNGEEPQKTLRP